MSTTRPYAADDRGSDSGEGESDVSAPERAGPDEPVRKLALSGESGIVPRARDFTRQALRDWGWLPAASADRRAAAEDVLLVVSELVTNACLHAGGPDELRLRRNPKSLRLEVVDSGPGEPSPRTPHRAGRPGGHGMFIVQRLCLDWGVIRETDRPGKTVWAELAAPA
ncbi:ATP-binding protein [Streptomyces sp. NPDC088910]|uniref:ATP-binding protein n=1 Tax=Streptomyces sp. NPDC088910 TaxID=3365911 RepID=UPI0037F3B5B2